MRGALVVPLSRGKLSRRPLPRRWRSSSRRGLGRGLLFFRDRLYRVGRSLSSLRPKRAFGGSSNGRNSAVWLSWRSRRTHRWIWVLKRPRCLRKRRFDRGLSRRRGSNLCGDRGGGRTFRADTSLRGSLDGAGLDRRCLFFGYWIGGRRRHASALRRKRWGCLGLTLSLSRSFRSLFSFFSFKFHLFLQRERRCLRLRNCRTERWCPLKPRWWSLGRTWF